MQNLVALSLFLATLLAPITFPYLIVTQKSTIFLLSYVDDLIIMGDEFTNIQELKHILDYTLR